MLFFTERAFIVIRHTLKLVLEFHFDLQNHLKQPKMWIFEKWKLIVFGQSYGIFWPKDDLKPCIIMYLGNIHNMSLVPVTFRNFFFKSSKNGTFWAKLRWVKMAWTFLPSSAHFFRIKNQCKITSRKKSSLTSARCCAVQVVKLTFLSKKMHFSGRKRYFFKKFILYKNVQWLKIQFFSVSKIIFCCLKKS